jgi:hypothetical protein
MEFMQYCQHAPFDTVLYTACDTKSARNALMNLERTGRIPEGMGMMPIVVWDKFTGSQRNPKNLQHAQRMFPGVKLHNCYLVDDISAFVALGQSDQWIPIVSYGTPYPSDDTELLRIRTILHDIQKGDRTVTRRGYHDGIVIIGGGDAGERG